jgi:signal transduction histidine kinase
VPIRKTLFIAFLGVSLVSAILLAGLAFVKARSALQEEIRRNARTQAESIAAQIDKLMFERVQNAIVWSELDVMQDLQVRDVDKRLSSFLASLHDGYRGVYLSLSCIAADRTILSSSDPALIGTQATPIAAQPHAHALLAGSAVVLEVRPVGNIPNVELSVPIASAFSDAELGELRLRLDFTAIYDVLDQGGSSTQALAVLDEHGTLIAASASLRERGLLLSKVLADWVDLAGTVSERDGRALRESDVIVSAAASSGFGQMAPLGWTTLVIQPVNDVLAPVHRMALILAALFLVIVPVSLAVAVFVSRRIARPIVALTRFTRTYLREQSRLPPPQSGSTEVRELSNAFVQLIEDIDRSQQSLIRASKLAVVGEMSAVIAHEVRTPLGILRSSAQMLSREKQISDEGKELLGFIESETDRLNRLVSAMLDISRPRASVFAPTNLHLLIRQSAAMLAAQTQKKEVSLTLDLNAADPFVECDEEQITQVLLNLLMNALQILPRGGHIEISTRDDAESVTVDVADDGPGIAEAERALVFEAFFFRREGGVGLGLAIVQGIVNAHHGQIAVDTSRFGGALFRFRLPRRQYDHDG